MTTQENYDVDALHSILEAEKTGAVELELLFLEGLPRELELLTSLQKLNLSGCKRLSGDLSPLANLTALQSLDLTGSALNLHLDQENPSDSRPRKELRALHRQSE